MQTLSDLASGCAEFAQARRGRALEFSHALRGLIERPGTVDRALAAVTQVANG